MAETVERLAVLVEANTKAFERSMKRLENVTERSMRQGSRAVAGLDRRIAMMGRQILATAAKFGLAFSGVAFVRSIGRAISAVAALGDAAETAGVSAEFLQVFRTHLEQNGASIRDADDAAKRFTRRLGEFANSGGGPAARALEELNIEILDASGNLRDSEDVMRDVIDVLGRIEDQARVSAFAAQLFGDDAGPRLLQALRTGIQGMDETEARMRRLGIVMSDEMVSNAQDLNDQFNFLSQIISTRFQQAVLTATGALTDSGTNFEEVGNKIGDFFDVIANNIHLLDNLAGALIGLMVAGPVGAAIGALVPELVSLFNVVGNQGTTAFNQATAALNALGLETAAVAGQSFEAIMARQRDISTALSEAQGNVDRVRAAIATTQELALQQYEALNPMAAQTTALLQQLGAELLYYETVLQQATDAQFEFDRLVEEGGGMPERPAPFVPPPVPPIGGATGGGGGRDQVQQVIADLNRERMMLRMTAEQQAIYNALARAGIDINDDRAPAVIAAVEALEAEEAAVDAVNERLERLEATLRTIQSVASDFFHTLQDGLEEGKSRTEAWADALGDLKSRLLDLALDIAIQFLFNALSAGVGNIAGGTGTGGGGGGFGSFLRGLFGRAAGGPAMPGVPIVVGERRPEIFVPETRGRIDPMTAGGRPLAVRFVLENNSGTPLRARDAGGRFDGHEYVQGVVLETIASGQADRAQAGRFGTLPRVTPR